MRSFITGTFTNTIKGDQNKENEMGRACNVFGRNEKCIENFGRKT